MGFVCGAPKGARGTGVPEVPIAALPRRMGPIFDASAGHYCPIAHGLKMRVFVESEVIRWAKSSQQSCSNNCDNIQKKKEKGY